MSQYLLLFPEIRAGRRDRFHYRGDLFTVKRPGRLWIISRPVAGHTAQCAFPIDTIEDLWNAADCLQLYEKHLYIDEDFVIHILTS